MSPLVDLIAGNNINPWSVGRLPHLVLGRNWLSSEDRGIPGFSYASSLHSFAMGSGLHCKRWFCGFGMVQPFETAVVVTSTKV